MLEASLREQRQPVSVEQAEQARDALPSATRAAIGSLVADHGPRARQHLAYQALGEWAPQQREAIRTLAAASPEVRAQVFAESGGSTVAFGESADPGSAGRSEAKRGVRPTRRGEQGQRSNVEQRWREPPRAARPASFAVRVGP